MNPYSKPTSPSSPSTHHIPARFISSIAKRPLSESGYYRSASKDPVSGPSDFTAKEDLEYLKSGYDSARPQLGSSYGSQGFGQNKLSTSDLAHNYATNHTNTNYAVDSNYLSKSIGGYSPARGSNTFLSPQRFIAKLDQLPAHNDIQNYYSADAHLEQSVKTPTNNATAADNFNIYSKKDDKQSRKFSEERLQAILDNVRNRKFEDRPKYGNPYSGVGSDPKILTPELSNITKENRDSFRSEDRPLQIRSSNLSQNSGIQTSSNLTTERGNREILNYLTNAPPKPGPYIDITSLSNPQTIGTYSANPASGIASYSPATYTPTNAFNAVNITEPTQKPVSYTTLYEDLKKNQPPLESKTPKEDEKGFSFRDNRDYDFKKDISFQKDSNLLGSSLLQSNYSAKYDTFENLYQPASASSKPIIKDYEPLAQSQPQPETQPKVSEQTQTLPHQPKPLENLKSAAIQTLSDSMRLKEQSSPYEISNLTSPPVRRHHYDTNSFESNIQLGSADSSMSKKTFYTIEHNNALAIRAFKDTVSNLAVAATPEKHTTTQFESPSLFEDLQRALNKQNVQINRIIIETVENYPSRGSPNTYRHQPEEYSRPDIVSVPSKALFEPPKNIVFQEIRKEPNELRTKEVIPQKLDYSNPASSINCVQPSEGGLISNEPSVKEIEPKETEKKVYESKIPSVFTSSQQQSISSAPPLTNERSIPNAQKSDSSQEIPEQPKSLTKEVSELSQKDDPILVEEPLHINYSGQVSERNDNEIISNQQQQLTEELEKRQKKQSIEEYNQQNIKSPQLSVNANQDVLDEPPLEIKEAVSVPVQQEEPNDKNVDEEQQDVQEPEENNNFEDATDVVEVQENIKEDSEKNNQVEVSNKDDEGLETDSIRHRNIVEPKAIEEIKKELPEEIKKSIPQPKEIHQIVPEEIKKTTPKTVEEPKSSNLAVKAVIGLLVILLLVILGSELMPNEANGE